MRMRMRTLLANRRARHEIAPGAAAEHPVIRHHPVSGRPCLFVNETFVRGIVNLPPIESEAILAMPDYNNFMRMMTEAAQQLEAEAARAEGPGTAPEPEVGYASMAHTLDDEGGAE